MGKVFCDIVSVPQLSGSMAEHNGIDRHEFPHKQTMSGVQPSHRTSWEK